MLLSELKCKDVVSAKECRKLGRVCDLEFDPCSGCICKIFVPGCGKVLGFLNCDPNIAIPYKDIIQIGPDIILVDIRT
ncbi:MAG: YlmC/YmxH family sporulation protein [Lachnospiraceae bacterium]|nr:YlmC/YmxH family sporulation protein [Lachnospiraceae bacterium]